MAASSRWLSWACLVFVCIWRVGGRCLCFHFPLKLSLSPSGFWSIRRRLCHHVQIWGFLPRTMASRKSSFPFKCCACVPFEINSSMLKSAQGHHYSPLKDLPDLFLIALNLWLPFLNMLDVLPRHPFLDIDTEVAVVAVLTISFPVVPQWHLPTPL